MMEVLARHVLRLLSVTGLGELLLLLLLSVIDFELNDDGIGM
jgi:hypothetical protein